MNLKELDKYRMQKGPYGTPPGTNYGFFTIPHKSYFLRVLCAPMDGDWQHVSVSLPNRCPNWEEMTHVKNLFWDENETVVQFHPKKTEYVNNHPYCLHMWKKKDEEFELPPMLLVGLPNLTLSDLKRPQCQ